MSEESTGLPQLVSVDEVSEMLSVSKRTIWRMLSSGLVPRPVKIGGSVRWNLSVLREWIHNGCPTPKAGK